MRSVHQTSPSEWTLRPVPAEQRELALAMLTTSLRFSRGKNTGVLIANNDLAPATATPRATSLRRSRRSTAAPAPSASAVA